ncbi:MAG TPA: xanthine dehydrogenase family protein subunit M [Polyangiaceae bacterium]|nr:xanthine dehydrogenase family protein subunit M [Polyangiaceae bacterium]
MHSFSYVRAENADAALGVEPEHAAFIAGGTCLVDLMRLGVMTPATVVDLTGLPFREIEATDQGITIGSLVKNSTLAEHPVVLSRYPALAQALAAGASPQLRNMATVGGNLLQRTRCPYFRNTFRACNKNEPGSGCAALDGENRSHAVLGGSDHCIAVNPSDMNVALVAYEAVVHTRGKRGERTIPIGDLHLVPGAHPEKETLLEPGELVTSVSLPALQFFSRARYVKCRDRASYDFALASAAAALDVQSGTIHAARVALGGVATKPWRSPEAESALVGRPATRASFEAAAAAAFAAARPSRDNAFKVELGRRTLVRALEGAAGA